jgi:signal transduction histidine kinase
MLLLRLWNQLSNIGIRPNMRLVNTRNIRIINQMTLITCLAGIIFGFFMLFSSDSIWSAFLCFGIAANSLVPICLISKRRLFAATHYFIGQYFALALLVAAGFGRISGMQFGVMLIPGLAILVLKKQNTGTHLLLGLLGYAVCEAIMQLHTPWFSLPFPHVYEIGMTLVIGMVYFLLIYIYQAETEFQDNLIKEKNGELKAAVGQLKKEIVEKNRIEDRLKVANSELQRFASLASHDMKEPLRTISSFAQLLNRRLPPEKSTSEFLHFITDAAQRMARLLDDLISYARAGAISKETEMVDLNQVLEQVKDNLFTLVQQTNARIETRDLPILEGHSTLFTQLFQNLVANGIKFQPAENAPRIEISAEKLAENWRFTVRDNGIGIPPEYQAQIFEPFRRLHARSEFDGSGIGLATCKKIIEFYGGSLELESAVGVGTAFHVFLPS